jgi:hypothetical protein
MDQPFKRDFENALNMFLIYEIKRFKRFLIFKSLLKRFLEASDLLKRGVLEIKSSYKFFPNRLFGQKMFQNSGYAEFEVILMKMFANTRVFPKLFKTCSFFSILFE